MNRIVNFFDFGFLQRWDRHLLLNNSLIWNTKLPYILFYGLFINISLFSFLYFYDLKLYQVGNFYYSLITIFSIISLATLIYWIYRQTKYVPTAEYAIKRIDGIKEYLLNLISMILILLPLITINEVIQLKYQYHTYDYSSTILKEDVLKLTDIQIDNSLNITNSIREKVRYNDRVINRWNTSPYVILWILGFMVFIPFLLIIYRNINLKNFLGALGLSLGSFLFAIFLDIFNFIKFRSENILTLLLLYNLIYIFFYFLSKQKFIIILSILIFNFFFLFLFIDKQNLRFIHFSSRYSINEVDSFLLLSLIFILMIISFLKKFFVNTSSAPKD